MKKLFVFVFIIIVIGMAISFASQTKVEIVENCKVLNLQQQQIIKSDDNGGMNTEYRYLVVTDKETFVCESSLINMKFKNSDVFWRLQKDSTYTFKVAGFGKTMVTEYRNILEIVR